MDQKDIRIRELEDLVANLRKGVITPMSHPTMGNTKGGIGIGSTDDADLNERLEENTNTETMVVQTFAGVFAHEK